MAQKIWNYGTDPINGLERKLELDTFLFQQEMDSRVKSPKICIF